MSIATALQNLKGRVEMAYDACLDKGGTWPATKDTYHLPDCIQSIPTGGGETADPNKDVLFIDFDGTVLHSFDIDEAAALTALPDYSTLDKDDLNLSCIGWNFTLAELTSWCAQGKGAVVGAEYVSTFDEHSTYISFDLTEAHLAGMKCYLQFNRPAANSTTVDWGDGTSETVVTGQEFHYYTGEPRRVTIEISTTPGTTITSMYGRAIVGFTTTNYADQGMFMPNCEIKVGTNVTAIGYAGFGVCDFRKPVVIPQWCAMSNYLFYNGCVGSVCICRNNSAQGAVTFGGCSLRAIVYPRSFTSVGQLTARQNLEMISVPPTVTTTTGGTFQNINAKRLALPGVTSATGALAYTGVGLEQIWLSDSCAIAETATNQFYGCAFLKKIVFPSATTRVPAGTFNSCINLQEIVFNGDVESIPNSTLGSLNSLQLVTFLNNTQVPTLGTSNFTNCRPNYRVVVPDALYDEWIAAADWSAIASHIVKASEL